MNLAFVKLLAVTTVTYVTAAYITKQKMGHIHQTELNDLRPKIRDEIWGETFQAGWDNARTHYSRYYTAEQYQLVFGTPRPW